MGNFEEHLKYGSLSLSLTSVVILGLAYWNLWSFQLLSAIIPIAFGFTIFGAILPDIDHHNSKPFKTIRNGVSVFVSMIVLVFFYYRFEEIISTVSRIAELSQFYVAFLGFLFATSLFFFTRGVIGVIRPTHRGFTHTHIFSGLIALSVSSGSFIFLQMTTLSVDIILSIALLFGVSIIIGISSHLYCDNILFN